MDTDFRISIYSLHVVAFIIHITHCQTLHNSILYCEKVEKNSNMNNKYIGIISDEVLDFN